MNLNSYYIRLILIIQAFILSLITCSYTLQAQNILDRTASIQLNTSDQNTAIKLIEKQYNTTIIYSSDILPDITYQANFKSISLNELFKHFYDGKNITWKEKNNSIVLAKSQQFYTLNGKITDIESGEELIGVGMLIKGTATGVTSNLYGFYSLTLPKGKYNLYISYLGYNIKEKTINLDHNQRIDFTLKPNNFQLEEILVTDKESEEDLNISGLQTGTFSLKKNIAKQMPSFFGENDPIKALHLLPGVQSGTEGSTGLFVRGGGADQNLILIDEAPVLNPSHFFNFFSIFNTDILKEIDFSKGAMPAMYGTRLSSVLDVRMREGNYHDFGVSGGIGTLSTKIAAEGPIKKGSSSFIVSGRRTYTDLFVKAVPNNSLNANALYFYDLNLKLDAKLSKKNKISLSSYLGRDRFGFSDIYDVTWGNQTASLRWNSIISKKLFLNSTAYWSFFRTRSNVGLQEEFAYSSRYNVRQYGFKQNMSWYIDPNHQVDFGYDVSRQRFFFGEIQPLTENSLINPRQISPSYTRELAAYVSYQQEIADKLAIVFGIRYSQYDNTGKGVLYIYDTDDVVSESTTTDNIIDTVEYKRGERYNTFSGLEPRVSLRYFLTSKSSIKMAYHRTRQYINLLSNTNVPSPVDMWAPVNPYIEPQIGDQYSIGYFRNFKNNTYEFSLEGYYKNMRNQIDFKPQANLLLNDHLETEILKGDARAYGMELFFRKKKGQFTGWISYTLSKAVRDIPGINNDNPYPTSYDRRHNISIVSNYKVNKHVDISANWVFSSGIAYSFPVGKYEKDQFIVPYYTSRNGFRLPPVHRLDVSATFYRKMSADMKNESSFNFSIYNLYSRKNTYAYIFRQSDEDRTKTEAVKLYLFTLLPSFTYNFKF
ncbi:MAG: hypothetical protein CMO01_21710 [Thalassobius sp.]|nr:hypothetical protein [Thalassovita sp.]